MLDLKKNWNELRNFSKYQNIIFHENTFSNFTIVTLRRAERNRERNQKTHFVTFFPEITQIVTQWMYIAANYYSHRHSACHVERRLCSNLMYKYCTICTVCNWTVLAVITHKLPLHVQQHNSIAHLLYKYCTNCTVCNRTVLQYLHTSCHYMFGRTTAQHIYCTNTVQTVQSATEINLQ